MPGGPRPGDEVHGRCRLCAGSRLEVLPFRYAYRNRHLVGVCCARCGLVFIDPQPTEEEVAALYDESYFTECTATHGAHGTRAYVQRAEASRARLQEACRSLERSMGLPGASRGRLLEIGCGPGYLLGAFRALGWTVTGLEISAYAAERARSDLGLHVIHGSIATSTFAPASFDAVLMGDVLEHLPDPLSCLRIVHGWLAEGGSLVVAVPSTMNLLSSKLGIAAYRLLGRYKTLNIPPYHLFEYTPRTARGLLAAAGFHVVHLRQSAVSLGRMGLRGTAFENVAKAVLQLAAIATSRLLNRGGDRLLLVARPQRETR
jgi:SAM-dependent methyltransferase